MKRCLALILFCLTGCATAPSVPHLVPAQTATSDPGMTTNRDPYGYLTILKRKERAEVSVGLYPDHSVYFMAIVVIKNLAADDLHVDASNVMLVNGDGIVQRQVTDTREIAYSRYHETPPERKTLDDRAEEVREGVVTFGMIPFVRRELQKSANEYSDTLDRRLFRDVVIPQGAETRGMLCYHTAGISYPVKVIVTVRDERFEFEFAQGN